MQEAMVLIERMEAALADAAGVIEHLRQTISQMDSELTSMKVERDGDLAELQSITASMANRVAAIESRIAARGR